MVYYAVAKGTKIGIFNNWSECQLSIKGFKQARFKKFDTREEAIEFINENNTDQSNENIIEHKADYYVYTNGSCHNNGTESAKAGIGIYFGENDSRNVSRRIEGKKTNNTAELQAIIETFHIIQSDIDNGKHIVIGTDSDYAIKCATTFGKQCAQQNWSKDIPNKELVQSLFELYTAHDNVSLLHIKAHTSDQDIHSVGNFHADRLANLSIGTQPTKIINKIYLNVPYKDKEIIKVFDGKWDKYKKCWYILEEKYSKRTDSKIV